MQFGPHTIEVSGLPFTISNQTIEERLRRFFLKYGTIRHCYSVPHPGDPFQCSGIGYVSFDNKNSAFKAVQEARLRCCRHFKRRVITLRSLETDVRQNPLWYTKERDACNAAVAAARRLYHRLAEHPQGYPVDRLRHLIERDDIQEQSVEAPTQAVLRIFGSWREFLDAPPFRKLFRITASDPPEALSSTCTYFKRNPKYQRLTKGLAHMIQHGVVVGAWKHKPQGSETWGSRAHLSLSKSAPSEELFAPLIPRLETPCYSTLKRPVEQDPVKRRPNAEGISLEEQFHKVAETLLSPQPHKCATANSTAPTAISSGSKIRTPSYKQIQFWDQLARNATNIEIRVFRRIVSPPELERQLRHGLIHTHSRAAKARSPYWKKHLPPIPGPVLKMVAAGTVKHKLPESLQYQSRPHDYYKRRVYDERHMLSREIANKRAIKRRQRRSLIRRKLSKHRKARRERCSLQQTKRLSYRIGLPK